MEIEKTKPQAAIYPDSLELYDAKFTLKNSQ